MMNITQVKQKTVAFQVIEQLKQLIASGALKANDKMPNEYELAEMFGVGRSTIREVLKIFQYMGVIELRNPKGTYICESSNISSESLVWSMLLGKKDFSEIVELRIVMEHQGLWYLLDYYRHDKKHKDRTVALLEQDIDNMRKALETESIEDRLIADYNFHGHIIEVCENEIFNNIYRTMRFFMVNEIKNAQEGKMTAHAVPQNHEFLLQSIIQDDYQTAIEKFRTHITNVDDLLTRKFIK